MKTFLLDSFNRYKRFSEELDVKTILCNKSWLIFNDCGDKELYVFQENGSLIASVNGNVTNAKWQYIPANKSLVVSFREQSFMFHPSFINNVIFALQQDGTERFAFMINEEQSESFYPKSLKELNNYFEGIERKRIEAEEQEKRWLIEQQRKEQQRIEEEYKRQQQYRIEQERLRQEEARRAEEERRIEQEKLAKTKKENDILKQYKLFLAAKVLGYILIASITATLTILAYNTSTDGAWLIVPPIVLCILYCGYKISISWLRKKILTHHLRTEKKKKEKEEAEIENAFKIQNKLNSNKDARELAKQILLRVENLNTHYGLKFRVNWICPNKTYKEVSLIINNGSDVLLYEHLAIWGSQEIKLKEMKPTIRITLRLIWDNIPVYKIILINKE